MSKYGVSIPITGYVYVEVYADTEEEAKDAAYQSDFTTDDIEWWDAVEAVCQGNATHEILNDVECEEIEEVDNG